MKKSFFYSLLMIVAAAMCFSCSSNDDDLDLPEVDPYNPPLFNITDTTLTSLGGEFTIKQSNDVPWFMDLYRTVPFDSVAKQCIDNHNLKNEMLAAMLENGEELIDLYGSWFKIKKTSDKEMRVTVFKNNTKQDRKVLLAIKFTAYTLFLNIEQQK